MCVPVEYGLCVGESVMRVGEAMTVIYVGERVCQMIVYVLVRECKCVLYVSIKCVFMSVCVCVCYLSVRVFWVSVRVCQLIVFCVSECFLCQ